jgi:hypothetical protein
MATSVECSVEIKDGVEICARHQVPLRPSEIFKPAPPYAEEGIVHEELPECPVSGKLFPKF